MLCRSGKENVSHLFIHCSYATQLWKEVDALIGFQNVWKEASVEAFLKKWFSKNKFKKL
jgi:hypothetical protein